MLSASAFATAAARSACFRDFLSVGEENGSSGSSSTKSSHWSSTSSLNSSKPGGGGGGGAQPLSQLLPSIDGVEVEPLRPRLSLLRL